LIALKESWRIAARKSGAGILTRIKNAGATKQGSMKLCGLPFIEQKRPMNGAQFHRLWVGNIGG